ncbi:MAG: tetratricopeptide repeat protein [Spirochaetales bacterium]|nr:tetratricopeptide repeat protein [Spirochaetales bacterium]
MKQRQFLILLFFMIFILASCQSPPNALEIAKEYYNLGNGYYKLGKIEESMNYYQIALSYDPSLSAARFNLCYAYIDKKDFESAEVQARQLQKLNPGNDEINNVLAYILSQKDQIDEALAIYAEVLERAPENITALNNSAILYWEQKKTDKAIELFNRIIQYDADNLTSFYNLGELYVSEGEFTKGIEKLQVYLEQSPEDFQAQLWLARGLRGIEEYADALSAYDQSLLLNTNQAGVWFEKAEILLLKVLDPQKGEIALEQALSMGYKDVKAIKELTEGQEVLEKNSIDDLLKKYKIDLSAEEKSLANPEALENSGPGTVTEDAPEATSTAGE